MDITPRAEGPASGGTGLFSFLETPPHFTPVVGARREAVDGSSLIEELAEFEPGVCFTTIKDVAGGWTLKQPAPDRDGDGICDPDDACPTIPGGFTGNPATYGCPDPCNRDSDGDGIPNCYDVCPLQPGDKQARPEANGCAVESTAPTEPRLVAPDPLGDCYVGDDDGTFTCESGSTHPSHRNETGRAESYVIQVAEPIRRGWTLSLNASVNASAVFGASISFSPSAQYTDRDVMDWNGDGIVDFVSPNLISLGARNRSIELQGDCYIEDSNGDCLVHAGVHESASISLGYGISFGAGSNKVIIKTTPPPENDVKDQHQEPPDPSSGIVNINFGGGFNLHFNYSGAVSRRIDMNGDALPDQVMGNLASDGLLVRFNLGQSLTSPVEFEIEGGLPNSTDNIITEISQMLVGVARGLEPINSIESFSKSYTYGGGGGLNLGIVGGSGSHYEHRGATLTQTTREFVDINGDGLIDIAVKLPEDDLMHIAFNMGDHFANPKTFKLSKWHEPISGEPFKDGLSVEEQSRLSDRPDPLHASGSRIKGSSGSGSGTLFFIQIGEAWSHTRGRSTVSQMLRDVDGDGIPDRLLRTGKEDKGAIQVSRGLFGGANLLKRVERPLGGVVELEYERSDPTEDSPMRRWNLSSVLVRQDSKRYPNYPEHARGSAMARSIVYEDAYHDRYEKQFFGYRTVTTARVGDGRVIEQEYENRDYWLNGLVLKEQVRDPEGKIYTESVFDYESDPWPGLSPNNYQACLGRLILPAMYPRRTRISRDSAHTLRRAWTTVAKNYRQSL